MGAKKSIEEIKAMLFAVHGDTVTLNECTYKNMVTPCEWVDVKHGSWVGHPTRVLNGSMHPHNSAEKRKQTCMDRFGAPNPWGKNSLIRTKMQDECFEQFGVTNYSRTPAAIEKAKKTSLQKYGVEFAIASSTSIAKRKATCVEKYGVENPYAAESVKKTIKNTNLQRYGVDHNWKGENRTCKQTWIKKYGVDNPAKVPEIKTKIKTRLQTKEVQAKIHETKKKNGSFSGTSKPEETLFATLIAIFGKDDIERWTFVNIGEIDFYVKSINVYVQLDGVYWHGLDRHIDEIKKHKNKRDVVIERTFFKDIQQNKFFEKNNMKLVRILDVDLQKAIIDDCLLSFVTECLK